MASNLIFKTGDKLIVELKGGELYEGDYVLGTKNRIDITNAIQPSKKTPIKGILSFYRSEVVSVSVLNQTDKETTTPIKNSTSNGVQPKVVVIQKSEYMRLKDMYQNYIYMTTIDKKFMDAVDTLNQCENIGLVGIGSESGRKKPLSLLVLSSWDAVYIFDVISYKYFPNKLKEILESHHIKKVIHNSKYLVDCLWHCYKVNLNNIFDTQVADMVIEKNNTLQAKESVKTLSDCLNIYLNFPNTLSKETREISKEDWEKRPLSESCKINAALLGTFLITLKNKLEEIMLKPFYDAVHTYSRSQRDINSYQVQLDGESVFRYDYTVARHKDVQFNKQLLFSHVHKNNNDENHNLVTDMILTDNEYQIKEPKCEVIHIGIVCSGYKSNLYFHTMLKSIYFYRNNPLHFHIMVNKFSKKVLMTLFETWAVPQVNVSFYNVNDSVADVRWVPNSHYSGIYGLLKLMFPKIIPTNVTDKIILLDTDLTFMSDIFELWNLFHNFSKEQVIGVVENQSDYYLKKSYNIPWPAIDKGFNTGVVLYNLERLRAIGWDKLWIRVAKKTASLFGATRLADQDVINAVIKQNPELVYRVPCQWNTQLSDHTHSYNCYNNNQIKVVHWNSPKKFNVVNKDGDYFRTVYTTFLEYNGNLLRRQLYACENISKDVKDSLVDVCSAFRNAQIQQWRTLLFFREYKYTTTKDDVTFVAQLSIDRLHMIEDLSRYWDGPISLTFYVTDPELEQCMDYIKNSEVLQDRLDIAYHVIFKEGSYYPINELRNVGLLNVNTPYVFLADADFLPMNGLYLILKKYISSLKSMDKKALIVPAFETQRYRSRLPGNKKELLKMLDNKSMFIFRYDVWPKGHAPVNYQKWKTATSPYQVKWQPDFEPYVVVQSNVTKYDRRFLGFGWNKVSHIMELEAQGYEFIVLPNTFIIHKPHAPSYDIGKFRKSAIYRMCLQNLKQNFVKGLSKKYGRTFNQKNNTLIMSSE